MYAAEAQIHYDAETGTFWDEGGLGNAGGSGGGGGGGEGGGGAGGGKGGGKGGGPSNPMLQRRRAEAQSLGLGHPHQATA